MSKHHRPRVWSDAQLLELWQTHQSGSKVAEITGHSERYIMTRRRRIEAETGIKLESKARQLLSVAHKAYQSHSRVNLEMLSGVIIVFSDAHFWPGVRSTSFDGLLWAIKELQPRAVICNGDAFDGASISRFPRIGWDNKPAVQSELEACTTALGEIEDAAKAVNSNVKLIWPLGNHDSRFEMRLAQNLPEFEGVTGFSLKDHFPAWQPCWACWPTDNLVVKHRIKGGVHATHNNTLHAGVSSVTGHLHSLKVTPFSDYRGTRFGVDTGTLADPYGIQFVDYTEDGPKNHREGFAVLTLHDGVLLWPELISKFDDRSINFRGKVIQL